MTIQTRLRAQRALTSLSSQAQPAGVREVNSQPSDQPEILTRDSTHRLDSPAAIDRLKQHGLRITPRQASVFSSLQGRWRAKIIAEETGRCIVENRFTQQALDGYFFALERVHYLGPRTSMANIVNELSTLLRSRTSLLSLAVLCGLFSLKLADEVWRQMRERKEDLYPDSATRDAIEAYRAAKAAQRAVLKAKS